MDFQWVICHIRKCLRGFLSDTIKWWSVRIPSQSTSEINLENIQKLKRRGGESHPHSKREQEVLVLGLVFWIKLRFHFHISFSMCTQLQWDHSLVFLKTDSAAMETEVVTIFWLQCGIKWKETSQHGYSDFPTNIVLYNKHALLLSINKSCKFLII